MIRLASAFLVAIVATANVAIAFGQPYPTKPIRMIVPYAPGGGTDNLARMLGKKMSEVFGQSVVVDNRSGAGGIIGTDVAANATPDGHTIAMVASTFTVTASVHGKLPYDAVRDFAPVTLVTFSPWVLVVNPSLPVRSVKELIALAKKIGVNVD